MPLVILLAAFLAIPYIAKGIIVLYFGHLARASWRALRSRGP